MQKPNKVSSQARLRRFVCHLGILTILLFIFARLHRYYVEYYSNSLDNLEIVVPYNEYIDEKAQFLPYPGYKILQFVEDPISPDFSSLTNYLNEQFDLTAYFKIVPSGIHHIILCNLKNHSKITQHQLSILRKEQELLDQEETTTSCFGKKLYMIDKREIRLEIELTDEKFLDSYKKYQKRWDEQFGKLIIERPTSFYLTLAYQYREIPHRDIYDELIKVLKLWETLPIEINLGPIEIASYANMISHTAVLSDVVFDE
jgi:hypothetical protein